MSEPFGFIKFYRSTWDNPVLKSKEPFSKIEAFIWIISNANWTEGRGYYGNSLVEIKRGQLLTSVLKMSEVFRWSNNKINGFLELLKKNETIAYEKHTKYTLITVVNYGLYQDVGTQNAHKKHSKSTSTAHQLHTIEEVKEVKEEINTVQGLKVPKDFETAEPDSQERYLKFQQRLKEEYPQVYNLKPITITRAKKLYTVYGQKMFWAKVAAMQNKPNLGKEYSDFGLTIENWLSKEKTLAEQAAIDKASRTQG